MPLPHRPAYPYSVIPGGIRSPAELKEAIARDPIVAAHFRDFNLAALRVVKLQSGQRTYVSYRLRDHVYWTRKQVRIAAGERLITDGSNAARTRCGNRISTLPQAGTLPSEPLAEEFETPQWPGAISLVALESGLPESPEAPAFAAPEFAAPAGVNHVPIGGLVFPPAPGSFIFLPPCIPTKDHPCPGPTPSSYTFPPACVPTKGHPCPTPTAVPEPETWLLLAPGLAYLFYRWKYRS